MAIALNQTSPSLFSTLDHEIFKLRSQRFYKLILFVPPVLTGLVMVLMGLARTTSGGKLYSYGVPGSGNGMYELGSEGAFAYASSIFSVCIQFFAILVGFSCARIVEQEFRWGTLKMLVTRQTNRSAIVLAKSGAAAVFVAAAMLSAIASWFVFALFLQVYYKAPFGVGGVELENLGKGLAFFATLGIQTFIYALGVMALTYAIKSSIGAIILFLIYKGIDAFISAFSTYAINQDMTYAKEWFRPLVPLATAVNPFLLGTSTNRTLMKDYYTQDCSYWYGHNVGDTCTNVNNNVVTGSSAGLAWVVMLAYGVLFVGGALYVLRRRDVNE